MPLLEPQRDLFTNRPPPADGGPAWAAMPSAPTTGPVVWVEVWNGAQVYLAHYACDLSGEEQPAYRGWFFCARSSGFEAVVPAPTDWRPAPADVCQSCGARHGAHAVGCLAAWLTRQGAR